MHQNKNTKITCTHGIDYSRPIRQHSIGVHALHILTIDATHLSTQMDDIMTIIIIDIKVYSQV